MKKGDMVIVNGDAIRKVDKINRKSIKVENALYRKFSNGYYKAVSSYSDSVCRKATKKEIDLIFAEKIEDRFSNTNYEIEKFIDNMNELKDTVEKCKYVKATEEIQDDYEKLICNIRDEIDNARKCLSERKAKRR